MRREPAARWHIDRLDKKHDRAWFDCGVKELNDFLRSYARQNQDADISRTWVATELGSPKVVGYYTLSAASIARAAVPTSAGRLPPYPVPAVHLGRLGVSRECSGQRLGETLLLHALEQVRISDVVGVRVVEVRAKDARARGFYERYGFERLIDDPLHLYLSLKKIAAALGD